MSVIMASYLNFDFNQFIHLSVNITMHKIPETLVGSSYVKGCRGDKE